MAGRNFALAGDFSTSVAMFLVREQPQKLGLTRLFHPNNYKDTTLLYRLQPYDSRKIPVLFVHGLQDTSATWMPMLNALLDDPQIRNTYQFWFSPTRAGIRSRIRRHYSGKILTCSIRPIRTTNRLPSSAIAWVACSRG